MILGSVSMVFAVAEDVNGTKYESAVSTLVDLGVISGYPDGTFKPDKNITRAEFCKVVIKALGLNYDGSSAPTVFTDVPSTHWASGYVQAAYELGVVNGRSATIFDPEANVSYNEAIAMIVRALGYEDDKLVGTYPTAHIAKAKGIGILGDVQVGSAAAPRGDVAQLVYNALSTPFVAYTGTNGQETAQRDSMLRRLTGATASTSEPAVFKDDNNDGWDAAAAAYDGLDVASGVNMKSYLGAYVTYFLNDDGDIVATKEVKSSFLTGKFNAAQDTFTVGDVDYTVKAGALVAGLAGGVEDFENGEYIGLDSFAHDNTDGTVTIACKVSGKTISAVYSAQKWTVTQSFMFNDDLDMDDKVLGACEFALDNNNEIDYNSFELLGADSIKDIKKDDVVYVYTLSNNPASSISKIEVGTKTADGKITAMNAAMNKYTVGGTVYKRSGENGDAAYALGNEGTFYLDYAGQIFHLEGVASDKLFAYAIESQNANASVFGGNAAQVQLFKADGAKEILDASKHAKTGNNWTEATLGGPLAAGTLGIPVVYTLNNSGDVYDIWEMVAAPGYDYVAPAVQAVSKKGVISTGATSYKLTNDTVIINVPDVTEPDTAKLLKASSLYDINTPASFEFIAKDGAIVFAFCTGPVTNTAEDYVLFNGFNYALDGNDEIIQMTTFANGKETSYTAMADNAAVKAAAATPGSLAAAKTVSMYTLVFDGIDVDSVTAVVTDADHTITGVTVESTADKGVIKNNVLILSGTAGSDGSYVLSNNVVVLKYNEADDVWKAGKTSDLTTRQYDAQLFDMNNDGEYDYVTVVVDKAL